ncbi:MAG: 2-phosphosulfolactate phosphatase [Flavobacteriales bacterium]|nr:2-phosphosulfolactate phosphatase [Flavobacteriales bacterium]
MTPEDQRKRVEVCFSPSQFHLYRTDFEICVVIDVLRATSAICSAIAHGVQAIIPVSTVEEARAYQQQGHLAAAEREGQIVEGFEFGNSPYAYMNPELKGKIIALTTTNGTRAINIASEFSQVVIGSLNNLDAVSDWLIEEERSVLLLGSGWKDKFNLEDTICAGAIADKLIDSGKFKAEEDSTIAAKFISRSARDNIFAFLKASSHRRRLKRLNLNEDVKYCLTTNTLDVIPVLRNGQIENLHS